MGWVSLEITHPRHLCSDRWGVTHLPDSRWQWELFVSSSHFWAVTVMLETVSPPTSSFQSLISQSAVSTKSRPGLLSPSSGVNQVWGWVLSVT